MRVLFVLASASFLFAQDPSALLSDPRQQRRWNAAQRNESHFIDEQIRICEIPAPPFMEETRGKELARLFRTVWAWKMFASIKQAM